MNVVCPVPAASTSCATGRVLLLWFPGTDKNERFSNILSKSLLLRAGTCPHCPPGEGSSSLALCGAGPLLLKVSGHCVTALVTSTETPPVRSPATFDHQTGGVGDTCNDAMLLVLVVLYVGAAVFSPLSAVLQAGNIKARCKHLSSVSITQGKPCRRQTLSLCMRMSQFEIVILKCPVFWGCALLAWAFIPLLY